MGRKFLNIIIKILFLIGFDILTVENFRNYSQSIFNDTENKQKCAVH